MASAAAQMAPNSTSTLVEGQYFLRQTDFQYLGFEHAFSDLCELPEWDFRYWCY